MHKAVPFEAFDCVQVWGVDREMISARHGKCGSWPIPDKRGPLSVNALRHESDDVSPPQVE